MTSVSIQTRLKVSIAGSYRRHKEIVRDLDFIVATTIAGDDHEVFRQASARREQ